MSQWQFHPQLPQLPTLKSCYICLPASLHVQGPLQQWMILCHCFHLYSSLLQMPPILQPPAGFLHKWKPYTTGEQITDQQLFWEFCFKETWLQQRLLHQRFSCTWSRVGQRNRGWPQISVVKTRKIVLHSGSVDYNRHSDTTDTAWAHMFWGYENLWPHLSVIQNWSHNNQGKGHLTVIQHHANYQLQPFGSS